MTPKRVELREDGPREGFQFHPHFVSTAEKVELIRKLVATGIKTIEVTSFVRPDRVPQLRDAAEVCTALPEAPGVTYTALYLNKSGFLRALEHPRLTTTGAVLLAASESFLQRNNNTTLKEALDLLPSWAALFREHQVPFERLTISTAFGDNEEGRIPAEKTLNLCTDAILRIADCGEAITEVTFADTTGWGNPESVRRLVSEFQNASPDIAVALHLHDTRGTGMANVYAGLLCGVERFDCSVGGMGGCPFSPGAAGNVPTEDVLFLCEELGVETGVSLDAYIDAAHFAESVIGHPLPGKVKQSQKR